jgi:capsular polysaccharide transport system permease protein
VSHSTSFIPAPRQASPPGFYAERADPSPALSPATGLSGAVRRQCRVVWALVLREILTRFGRRNLGFLWIFLEPALFVLAITFIWSASRADIAVDIPITAFILTGYSTVLLWRNMPSRCIRAMAPNAALLHHQQVRPLDVYFARIALELAGATISFIFLAAIFTGLGLILPPEDTLKVLGGWALMAWYGLSLALFLGPLSEQTEFVEKIWSPLSLVLLLSSGAFFMLEMLPEPARHMLLWLPTVNCIEFIREGYFGSAHTFYYSLPYVVAFNSALMLLGLAQVRYLSRHLVLQ